MTPPTNIQSRDSDMTPHINMKSRDSHMTPHTFVLVVVPQFIDGDHVHEAKDWSDGLCRRRNLETRDVNRENACRSVHHRHLREKREGEGEGWGGEEGKGREREERGRGRVGGGEELQISVLITLEC